MVCNHEEHGWIWNELATYLDSRSLLTDLKAMIWTMMNSLERGVLIVSRSPSSESIYNQLQGLFSRRGAKWFISLSELERLGLNSSSLCIRWEHLESLWPKSRLESQRFFLFKGRGTCKNGEPHLVFIDENSNQGISQVFSPLLSALDRFVLHCDKKVLSPISFCFLQIVHLAQKSNSIIFLLPFVLFWPYHLFTDITKFISF